MFYIMQYTMTVPWYVYFCNFYPDKSVDLFNPKTNIKLYFLPGFPIGRNVMTTLVRRYGGRENTISLDDFIICMSKLVLMFRKYYCCRPINVKENISFFIMQLFL